MNISTVCTIGKSLAIKREKDDDADITRAHLKFSDLFLTREQANALAGMRPGWCETALFDELGAPLGSWSLALDGSEWSVAGSIDGPGGEGLRLTDNATTLAGVVLTLTKLGVSMAGELSWHVGGDEAGDAEPLLGRQCAVTWHITDGGQRDMLRESAA